MQIIFSVLAILMSVVLLSGLAISDETILNKNGKIRSQNLTMNLPGKSQIYNELLLPGEIADTELNHVIVAGPFSKSESLSKEHDNIFLFIKGKGSLKAGDRAFIIDPESIAFPSSITSITIEVTKGDTLHYINIQKKLSQRDLDDIKFFPEENRNGIYFSRFDDCEAYTEKIKSPNTVSRTVLPKDYIPRVAMGTVETSGPDEVGAHKHPMLDQLFLGLAGNDVTVHADGSTIHFPEFTLLHIPIGSSHWVTVNEGKRMYYQWMDFFLTKEGEKWLKTHKPINNNNK